MSVQCQECLENAQGSLHGSGRGSAQGSVHGSQHASQHGDDHGSQHSGRGSHTSGTRNDRPNQCDPRYVLIRMNNSKLLECRNTLNSNMSVFRQYEGKIIGFGHTIHILENEQGRWDGQQSIVVLWFPDEVHAQLWWDCMPVMKQPDWLHGVDIVIIPARPEVPSCPPYGKGCLMLSDIDFHDCADRPDYNGTMSQKLRETGAICGLTATQYVVHKRGTWDPRFVTMNYFTCEHRLQDFYNSEEYSEAKQARQVRGISDVVYFNVQPL